MGPQTLLEVLRNSPLEKLNFECCSQIPSTAWQKLQGASWTNLREASFSWCLVLQTWLRCLSSTLRCRIFFEYQGPLSRLFLWQHLATLKGQTCEIVSWKWSDMQKSLARGTATDCRPLIPTVPFWALQVLWWWHQCRWGCRPAGSLAQLSCGEVELWSLLSNSVHCVAEAAWCQLDQLERSKLLMVPRLANLVAMFGQFVRRRVCSNVKAIVMAVSLTTFGNSEKPKMWNRQFQVVGHAKVTCKRSGNRLPSFSPHSLLFSTPGALTKTPKVRMGPQTCWKSCGNLPWRSWNFLVAIEFRPLRGSEFPMAHGPRCVMHPASPRRSCTASVAATSRGCFRCFGWMRRWWCR